MTLRRARIVLAALVVVAIAILVRSLPSANLVSERRSMQSVSRQLAHVRQENIALRNEAAKLGTSQEIESLAHQEYGLVAPGQKEYVILPGGGAGAGSGAGARP